MRKTCVAVMVALGACTGSANYWVAYEPANGTTSAAKASAIQKSVIALTDSGREIESSDASTGIVLTKWFSADSFGGDQTRFRIRVSVDDAGGYDIAALCQSKSAMTSAWNDGCGDEDKRPRFVVEAIGKVEAALR